MISLASMPVGVEARPADHALKTIVVFCCIGLVASFSLMARGIDLSAGLM